VLFVDKGVDSESEYGLRSVLFITKTVMGGYLLGICKGSKG
jgi:hypothetical protein